jgi:exodeoxyribonuclease VII small subunit
MATKNTLTYESAYKELSSIVKDIEQENVPLDELTKKIERANTLIAFCKERLRQTEEEYQKVVAQLKQ